MLQENFMLESIIEIVNNFQPNTLSQIKQKIHLNHLQQLINPENKYIAHNLSRLIFPQFN